MKLELPERKKPVYEMTLAIRWGDMDAMGHVNNAVYFQYIETVRTEWLNSLGVPPDPRGQGPVIVNAFCTFHRQLEYPGELRLRMYASDPGRSSFETWVTIERIDDPGVVYASGGATTVWVDFPAGRSTPLPDWLREHLS